MIDRRDIYDRGSNWEKDQIPCKVSRIARIYYCYCYQWYWFTIVIIIIVIIVIIIIIIVFCN